MLSSATKRPRNVNAAQAAAILYGDWGTSKAYVIGLAFAIAGYSSVWLIIAMSCLMALVGFNYITICKFSPTGGGVYTAARKRSEVLALIGAFFLIADYLITASLSALSCFEYLEVAHPVYWAVGSICFIGVLNFFGPRHSGNFALLCAISTAFIVVILGIIALPYVDDAIHHTTPLKPGFWPNWVHFVSVIVALSGVEAIANTTGVMRLNPGTTEENNPSVSQASTKAILWVMMEVCFFTAFFGLMMNALPGLTLVDGNVQAPGGESIRDQMLRYMGEYFVSHYWGGTIVAHIFGYIVGLTFAILLLSAVNTAMVALVSLLFVMSRDGEMPSLFQKLNYFGVPKYPLLVAALVPALIVLIVHDVAGLANLYAVGFVGAIATNLGVTAYDRTVPMSKFERYLMWFTFAIMMSIEITLFIDKPDARRFAFSVMTIGLILRALVVEFRQRQWTSKKVKLRHASLFTDDTRVPLHQGAILCAVRTIGKTLNFALQEAKQYNQPLYILFIREQKVMTEEDRHRMWLDDPEACRIFDYAKDSAHEVNIKFFYEVSDSPVETIMSMAQRLHISRLILGRPRHSVMLQMLRGNIVQEISEVLPPDIDLLVIS